MRVVTQPPTLNPVERRRPDEASNPPQLLLLLLLLTLKLTFKVCTFITRNQKSPHQQEGSHVVMRRLRLKKRQSLPLWMHGCLTQCYVNTYKTWRTLSALSRGRHRSSGKAIRPQRCQPDPDWSPSAQARYKAASDWLKCFLSNYLCSVQAGAAL